MSLKNFVFVTTALLFFQLASAQRNYDQNNHIGLIGGVGFFDITTSDFETEQGTGYMFAFTTRGAFYNNFDLIYGINFIQNQIGILANNELNPLSNFQSQYVNYTMQSVQINLLGSYNIVKNHLSLEAGPLLNVNSKMKLDQDEFENFIVAGYDTITSKDLQNVSRVHFRAAAGITAGIENFRVGAMYQYGVTNLFNRYNDNEGLVAPEGKTFKGNTSTILVTATLYL